MSQSGDNNSSNHHKNSSQSHTLAAVIFGGFFAIGLIGGSMVLGHNAQVVARTHESISVKGTAEKSIKADVAKWGISLSVQAKTIPEGLALLKTKQEQLLGQFSANGAFNRNQFQTSDWNSFPNYLQRKHAQPVLTGYTVSQYLSATFNDVSKPAQLNQITNGLIINGMNIEKPTASYFISNIEPIKLSMIADATQNAHARAAEFAKSGDVAVGQMHSASQGLFDIRRADDIGTGEDGGGSDTSSIEKKVRVVVTVEYGIK